MRPSGETQTISVMTSAGAAERFAARVDEVKVVRHAVNRRVHVHRRDDHAILQLEATQAERLKHRRRIGTGVLPDPMAHLGIEPCVDIGHELGVAKAQVVVGDAPAPCQDVERELERILVHVLAEVLEPLEACLRRTLRRHDDWLALGFVRGERTCDARLLVQTGGERKRVLHRELRPGSDREVRGVGCVTEKHDVGVRPRVVAHRGEADPPRVVGMHCVPIEDVAE